jgi:hypothetical protein
MGVTTQTIVFPIFRAGNNTTQDVTATLTSLTSTTDPLEAPREDLELNSHLSANHIIISDEDLLPSQPQEIAVASWHSTFGFCESIPPDLENLCREIEATGVSGVSGAMHKEVSMGRYVYWSWKATWTIVAGLHSTFQEKRDTLLFNTRSNKRLPPSYDLFIEPATIMDFGLGDALLAKARISFSGIFPSPPISSRKTSSPSPAKLYQPTETIYGSDELFLKMEIVYPSLTATRAAPLDRIEYLRNFCKLKIHLESTYRTIFKNVSMLLLCFIHLYCYRM